MSEKTAYIIFASVALLGPIVITLFLAQACGTLASRQQYGECSLLLLLVIGGLIGTSCCWDLLCYIVDGPGEE